MPDSTDWKDAAQDAASMAAPFEGFSASPYLDMVAVPHVWTIGFGSLWWFDGSAVTGETRQITRDEGVQLLQRELTQLVTQIATDVGETLTEHQATALLDFAFNVGIGNFEHSTLLRCLRGGDFVAAANEFDKWDHAGGKEILGLLKRRSAEAVTFLTPDQASTTST
jgi:lysozyme